MGYDFKEERGIQCYFTKIEADELLSTTDVLVLPTLWNPSLVRFSIA